MIKKRAAGILLHPTSLPCSDTYCSQPYVKGQVEKAFGTLGKDAYYFVDFMMNAGLSVWQMLPTGPTQDDMSPYQSISAHAGNPHLISLDWLIEKQWINREILQRENCTLTQCASHFYQYLESEAGTHTKNTFHDFCSEHAYWLDDFSLFSALRKKYNDSSWINWPDGLRQHDVIAIDAVRKDLQETIDLVLFEQFAFFSQWHALKKYANERGIQLFGDIPIFVGHDSADVWAQQEYFQLDGAGNPLTVAGVPPDYFSEFGQHWGNPHYNWDKMKADGFQWWLARLKTQSELFDLIRIDHFRAFDAYWEIPGNSKDARSGQWVKAPGDELLKSIFATFPQLNLIAENLGLITDEVEELRHKYQLPGMLVLQFAFDGNTENPHLPHNHKPDEVIYTGTHDNDTSLSWHQQLTIEQREQLSAYCFNSSHDIPWLLIEVAMASVGHMAIIPMQDFLALDGGHRMNTPGTTENNWTWTFSWQQIEPDLAKKIHKLVSLYQRDQLKTLFL
jgi:4-alpha-glucanotransferase